MFVYYVIIDEVIQNENLRVSKKMTTSNLHAKLVVLGAGPGGYTAAFYAADMGLEVTLVDDRENLGGICLNHGCIPSKTYLHAAKFIQECPEMEEYGISVSGLKIDIDKLRARKDAVVNGLSEGLKQLSAKRKINLVRGNARLTNANTLLVEQDNNEQTILTFDNLILSTGSRPATIPIAPQSTKIMDSTAALELRDVPKKLLVVGGGYIGIELGQFYAAIGSEVSVVEMTDGLLPGADKDLARVLNVRLRKQFSSIMIKSKVLKIEEVDKGVAVEIEDKSGKVETFIYDKVLISVGRRPNVEDLGLEEAGIALTGCGFVKVDEQRRTSVSSVFAIGDIAGQPMLAHKAAHEAKVAVDAILEKKTVFGPAAIPAVIFTGPEIAWCGLTEIEAKDRGIEVKTSSFKWGASGRAATQGRPDGLTKLIVDPTTERVLGVGIVGHGAGELIAGATLAIEMGAVVQDLALTIHPHPTFSETIMEAAEVFLGHCTHTIK